MTYLLVPILALALLLPPAPAPFSAHWERPGVARLAWTQPAGTTRACLVRVPSSGQPIPLDCYDDIPPGATVLILLGATAPVDGQARPQAGDSFVLDIGDTRARAALRGVVYVGVIRR